MFSKEKNSDIIKDMLICNYNKYYRIAYKYLGNREDALDAVQEGAYKAVYNAGKLRQKEFADAWICKIVINKSIDILRRRQGFDFEIAEKSAGIEDTYEDLDLRRRIDTLPEKDKAVILLRYFEDMTLEQISLCLGENMSTVKSRLYRTLKKLKISLTL